MLSLPVLLLAFASEPQSKPESLDSIPFSYREVSSLSPDHRRLAGATDSDGIWILNLTTKRVDLRVPARPTTTAQIAWSTDASALALLGTNESVDVVDSSCGAVRATLMTGRERKAKLASEWNTVPRSVAFAAGGSIVLVALGEGAAELWSVTDRERIAFLGTEVDRSTAMAVSKDGQLVALGSEHGNVSVWKARTGERAFDDVTVPPSKYGKGIHSLAFDPRGETLAIGASDCRVRLWRFGAAAPMRELSHCDEDIWDDLAIGCVRFSADGSRLLSTSFTYWEARVWDVATGRMVDHFDYGGGNPCPMPAWFSSDNSYITMALDCFTAKVGEARSPTARPPRRWVWWHSDGDVAWAIVDGVLVVRRVTGGDPIVKLQVRGS
jgi:WD40 repeat protein